MGQRTFPEWQRWKRDFASDVDSARRLFSPKEICRPSLLSEFEQYRLPTDGRSHGSPPEPFVFSQIIRITVARRVQSPEEEALRQMFPRALEGVVVLVDSSIG
jgi:hypothetical protein